VNVTIFCGSGVLQSVVIAKNHCRHKENAVFFFLPGLLLHVPIVTATTKNRELFPIAGALRSLWCSDHGIYVCPAQTTALCSHGGRIAIARWSSMWCAKHVWRLFYAAKQHQSFFICCEEGGK